jgi:hypothetical protein
MGGRPQVGEQAMTAAERQRRRRAKLAESRNESQNAYIKKLEEKNARLRNNAALGAVHLNWEFEIDDTDDAFLSLTLEPFVLFINPHAGDFDWWVGEDREDDEDLINVAAGTTRSLVTAMVAAETAVERLRKQGA